ncbi:hypothetical protein GOODEAATRI_004860, partial [Goodea atripinnis]
PNAPLPQPQSRNGSRRTRAILLSKGPRKPRSLYTPTLCLADAESEYQSRDYLPPHGFLHRITCQNLLAVFNISQTHVQDFFYQVLNNYFENSLLLKCDTLSSSPSSTPMGSMESLSSHSSEQNTSSKPAFSGPLTSHSRPDLLRPTPSQLSNGSRSGACVSSAESSSREEGGRTDGESEDTFSLSSVSTTPRLSPAPKKAPHCCTDLKPALLNRTISPSLKSLQAFDGRIIIMLPFDLIVVIVTE